MKRSDVAHDITFVSPNSTCRTATLQVQIFFSKRNRIDGFSPCTLRRYTLVHFVLVNAKKALSFHILSSPPLQLSPKTHPWHDMVNSGRVCKKEQLSPTATPTSSAAGRIRGIAGRGHRHSAIALYPQQLWGVRRRCSHGHG